MSYVMGRTSEEYQRLRKQALLLEANTRSVLEKVGVSEGMSCLDVGCGPCEVMRLMAEMVGPSGKVTGLDVDGKLGRESIAILTGKGHEQCSFVEGDLYSEPLGKDSSFDIVFSRLVLVHLDDQLRGLQQMFSWVKPGGCLIVQDYHFDSIDVYPPYRPAAELKRVFLAVCLKAGRETQMGLKLPAAFIEAGIGAPDGTDVAGFLLPMPTCAPMFAAVYRSILPKALEFGITTKEASDSFFAEIERAPADSYAMWPLLVTSWRRKPV